MAKTSVVILLTLGITAALSKPEGGVMSGGSGAPELSGGGLSSEGGGAGLIGLGGVEASPYGTGESGHQLGGHPGQGGYGGSGGHGEAQEDSGWGWNQETYDHPKYAYSYGVKDKMDQKQASEWRDGKTVQGSYSLMEPDGSWRTVNYYDDGHGFNAMVHHTPVQHSG